MHEVVHLSFGPQANELNTKFYNKQQSYFVYSKEDAAKSHVDPSVRFVYGKEVTPRAAFWDYRNGFANFKIFNDHYEEPQTIDEIRDDQERPTIALTQENKQQPSSTWTSRVRFPLHPLNLHTIPDWESDPEAYPFGHQRGSSAENKREFDVIEEGMDQFKVISGGGGSSEDDYLDVTFRPIVEKCDLLDGVNVVTDLGGWSGFTIPFIEAMRDEFIPKAPILTWCISRNETKYRGNVQKSRIEALAALAEHSSLVLPLQDIRRVRTVSQFEENAAFYLPSFETVNLLSSLRRDRVSMQQLSQDLTIGAPSANIIQSYGSKREAATPSLIEFQGSPQRVRNTVDIWRGGNVVPNSDDDGTNTDRSQNHKQYWCPEPLDSEQSEIVKFKLELNDNPLKLRKMKIGSDHSLRELIYDLTEPYIWGWEEPSDDDDFF